MDLDGLQLFVDLADTGSFSKAAERHCISQSAVSQRIRTLEAALGHRLVERGKGRAGAEFTEAGTCLLTGAREILARADALKHELADLSESVRGALNVATVYSIGLHALTPTLKSFLGEYPGVNLHLEYLRTDRIYDAIASGAIDCGIVACPRVRPGIEIVPLGEEPLVVILPPEHLLATEATLTLSQLQDQPFVAFDPDIPTRRLIDDALRLAGVSVNITQTFDNIETIKRVVEIGLGISIVPEPTIHREVRDETLVVKTLTDVSLTRPTGILLRAGRSRNLALQKFLLTLKNTP
jgi:LysR family transcriptional regulator, transcriptional activator of the cysJI operon